MRGDNIPTFFRVKKKVFLSYFFFLPLHLNLVFGKKWRCQQLKIIVPSADVAIMVDNVQLALHRVLF